MKLIYAKKFRFPHYSANYIQGISMCAAFAGHKVKTVIYPSLKKSADQQIEEYLSNEYGLDIPESLQIKKINSSNMTVYGGLFTFNLLKGFLNKESVFFTRELNRAFFLVKARAFLRLNNSLIHEVHDFKDIEMLSFVFKRIDGIVFIHKRLAQEAVDKYNYKGSFCIAASGFNEKIFSALPLNILAKLNSNKPVYLTYFGTISKIKGIDILVQMLNFLPDRFRLKLIGNFRFGRQEWLNMINDIPNATERIILKDLVPHCRMPEALVDTDVVVIPSTSKDWYFSQIKVYESLALGLPIVCTPLPHLTDILKHKVNAFVSDEVSSLGLAKAVETLMTNVNLLIQMREQNLELACKYTWSNRAGKVLDFIETTK